MDDVKSILAKVLKKRGLQKEAGSSEAVYVANRYIQKHAKDPQALLAVQVKDGALVVDSLHSIAAQEGYMLSQGLLAHVQRELPQAKVERVLVRRATAKAEEPRE